MCLGKFARLLAAMLVCLPPCSALADVITVDDDYLDYPAADFDNLYSAHLASVDGDEILVYPGVYQELAGPWSVVDLSNSVTLRSVAGPQATFIRGNGKTSMGPEGITVTADNVLIEGFTFDGGNPSWNFNGSALYVSADTDSVVIRDCIFTDNTAQSDFGGGVISSLGTNVLFDECRVIDNWLVGITGTDGTTLVNTIICDNYYNEPLGGDVVVGEGSCVNVYCKYCPDKAGDCDGADCEPGSGNILLVPKNYATIGAALAAADPCDRILVAPGIYEETLTDARERTVSVEAIGPAGSVIILPPASSGPSVTILGCYSSAAGGYSSFDLHGIVLDGANATAAMLTDVVNVRFFDCEIRNWTAAAALLHLSGTLHMDGCDVHDNVCTVAVIDSKSTSNDSWIGNSSFYLNDAPLVFLAGEVDADDYSSCMYWTPGDCCNDCINCECCYSYDPCTWGDVSYCNQNAPIISYGALTIYYNNSFCVGDGDIAGTYFFDGYDCFNPYDWLEDNDCNCNGVRNAVELNGGAPDCNDNGLPDDCDWDNGTLEDCDGDGLADSCAIADGVAPDCNENDVPDACDIDSGEDQDCNENGIPDTCEPDCNGNGQPDECDVDGGGVDCNGNGLVDSCEIESGTASDCDGNGIPDACDVANGAIDRNGNGIQDVCDIYSGVLTDCDGDMVPDMWQRPRPGCGLQTFYLSPPAGLLLDVGIADVGHGVIVGLQPPNEIVTWNLDPADPNGTLPWVQGATHDGCRTFNYNETWTLCPELAAAPRMTQVGNLVVAADGVSYLKPFSVQNSVDGVEVLFECYPGYAGTDGEPPGGEGPDDPGVPPGEDHPPGYWTIGEGAVWPGAPLYFTATGVTGRPMRQILALTGTTAGGGGSVGSRVGDGSGRYPGLDDWQDSREPSGGVQFADLNGDGLDDMIVPFTGNDEAGMEVYLATGIDQGSEGQDPDGDGFPGGVQWATPQIITVSMDAVNFVAAGDTDGDGLQELLFGSKDEPYVLGIINLDADGLALRSAHGDLLELPGDRGSLELWGLSMLNIVGDARPEVIVMRESAKMYYAELMLFEMAGPYSLRYLDSATVITDGPTSLQAAHVGRPGAGPTSIFAGAGGWCEPFASQIKSTGLLVDLTGDGLVGIDDLLIFIDDFGGGNMHADLNRNGEVDIDDMLMLLDDWGALYEGP